MGEVEVKEELDSQVGEDNVVKEEGNNQIVEAQAPVVPNQEQEIGSSLKEEGKEEQIVEAKETKCQRCEEAYNCTDERNCVEALQKELKAARDEIAVMKAGFFPRDNQPRVIARPQRAERVNQEIEIAQMLNQVV